MLPHFIFLGYQIYIFIKIQGKEICKCWATKIEVTEKVTSRLIVSFFMNLIFSLKYFQFTLIKFVSRLINYIYQYNFLLSPADHFVFLY